MPIKKSVILFILLRLFCIPNIGAQSLDAVIPGLSAEVKDALASGNILSSDTIISSTLLYAPTGMPSYSTKDADSDEEESFIVESVSLLPIPDDLQDYSEDELMVYVLNILRAVSTQEGITYISHRRGDEPYPLYTKSYHVEKVGSKKRIDDPVLQTLPVKIEDIVYQKDTSFAGNYYKFSYATRGNQILLSIENLTTLAVFGLVPAVPKNTLKISFTVILLDEGFLCYSQAEITGQKPTFTFLGFSVHLPSAFQRRITALQEWFSDNLSL